MKPKPLFIAIIVFSLNFYNPCSVFAENCGGIKINSYSEFNYMTTMDQYSLGTGHVHSVLCSLLEKPEYERYAKIIKPNPIDVFTRSLYCGIGYLDGEIDYHYWSRYGGPPYEIKLYCREKIAPYDSQFSAKFKSLMLDVFCWRNERFENNFSYDPITKFLISDVKDEIKTRFGGKASNLCDQVKSGMMTFDKALHEHNTIYSQARTFYRENKIEGLIDLVIKASKNTIIWVTGIMISLVGLALAALKFLKKSA